MHKPTERAARQQHSSRDVVDETSEDSFPASDAPSWGPLRVGAPITPVQDTAPFRPPPQEHQG